MNKEHGHILPYDEMLVEFMEMYDGGDPTNCAHWSEYYEYIGALNWGRLFYKGALVL